MLEIQEMEILRGLIDEDADKIVNRDLHKKLLKIHDKLSDMILLRKAWNRGLRIEIERTEF